MALCIIDKPPDSVIVWNGTADTVCLNEFHFWPERNKLHLKVVEWDLTTLNSLIADSVGIADTVGKIDVLPIADTVSLEINVEILLIKQ